MTLGHGEFDFFADSPDGVAQCVATRLSLWRGQWFIDTEEGTPWIQEVLGKRSAVEAVLRERILETPGVQELNSFEAIFDPDTRRITIAATISTIYGDAALETHL